MSLRTGVLAAVVSVALGACATNGRSTRTRPIDPAVTRADRSHQYSSPGGARRAVPHAVTGARTPLLAVTAFAVGYINWTARTVSGRMRGLAALSVGQARSMAALAAAQTARDYELRRSGVANAGVVEAIAPVIGRRDTYAVVTRERTTASATDAYRGLAPSWHVALATTTATRAGWVVSGWQPEN